MRLSFSLFSTIEFIFLINSENSLLESFFIILGPSEKLELISFVIRFNELNNETFFKNKKNKRIKIMMIEI